GPTLQAQRTERVGPREPHQGRLAQPSPAGERDERRKRSGAGRDDPPSILFRQPADQSEPQAKREAAGANGSQSRKVAKSQSRKGLRVTASRVFRVPT